MSIISPDAINPTHDQNDMPVHGGDLVLITTDTGLDSTGNGLRLLLSNDSQTTLSMHLAPLIAESFALREAFLNGPHDSIEAMSKALRLPKGHVTSCIRLTYLSPTIIRKILNGDVTTTLSQTRLLDASKNLPAKWADQERFLAALAR